MRSAMTAEGSTLCTCFSSCSICSPTRSIVCRSGPLIFTPMGARMPLCSMTMRAAMGWSLGAPVVPGSFVTLSIWRQMSSGDLMELRHWR